ncbi:MAG TPA: HEAT repeat domain-containing protein [Nitrospirota bacterium]
MSRSDFSIVLRAGIVAAAVVIISGCASQKAATMQPSPGVEPEGQQVAQPLDPSVEVKGIVETLRTGARKERDEAYKRLVTIGEPAVPQLLATLGDSDADVKEYAAAALGDIGDRRAVKPLLDMLANSKHRRYVAAWALGKIKAEEAVVPLIGCLSIKNDALQKESTRALISIGGPSVPALIAALDSKDDDTRKFSARALGIIEDKSAEQPLVKRLKDDNQDVASAAVLALGTAGTHDCIASLIGSLTDPNMMTRVNATISLGTLAALDAVDPLTKIMDSDQDPYVREWSARALENITGNRYKYRDEHGAMIYPYNLYR